MDEWMAGEARVIRAPIYIELLETRPRGGARGFDSKCERVEEVVCVCEGNRGYIARAMTRPWVAWSGGC